MFASVLERNLPPRQIVRGAALAVGVHATVIAATVFLSSRPPVHLEKEIPALTIFAPSRFVELGPAVAGAPARRASSERRSLRAVAAESDRSKKRAPETTSSTASGDVHAIGDPSAASDGSGNAPSAGTPGGAIDGRASSGETRAIPFGEGMVRPSLIAQTAPRYSREASAARAEGSVIAKCVITVEGTLRNCRIVKGVPHMDAAVIDALSHWRYTPVTFQGRAVSVDYTINLRLVAP